MILATFLKPTRVKLALLLPGIGFLLLELVLEPEAVLAAWPGLLIWAIFYYGLASLVLFLRDQGAGGWRFRRLLYAALFLAVLDQVVKLLVLRWFPLGQERTLVAGALTVAHAHNVHGSWLASQFELDFLGKPLLVLISVLFAVLSLSLYRYYVDRRGRPRLWAAIAVVGFVAAMSSAFVDLAIRGFTVDYLGVAGLVVADLKDFYLDVAIAALFAEIAENYHAARQMGTRQTIEHLKGALEMSMPELSLQGRWRLRR